MSSLPAVPPAPDEEVVRICQSLLQIDTTNRGDGAGNGERAAAEYIMRLLTEVGLVPEFYEPEPRRSNVVLRMEGTDRRRPGLVLHGHLDVVPADPHHWTVHPFGGEERDGCLWGRGAIDMKDMVAMMVANLRWFARTGNRPPRDIVFAFFADEEAGGQAGAGWLTRVHPELFSGCTEAVSEVGGFSISLPPSVAGTGRVYLIQTAEKGVLWLRLRCHGKSGHGSLEHRENAVLRLAQALDRIGAHEWPTELIPSVQDLFRGMASLTGVSFDGTSPDPVLEMLGGARQFVESTLRDVANPTMIAGGYKHNVLPEVATAALDCRFLPGHEDQLLETITGLAGEYCEVEVVHRDVSLSSAFDSPLVASMKRAIQAEDPGAHVLPYCLSGGTDNKHLSRLDIDGYGFVPLRLPAGLDFASMFHGVDERVPVDSLRFGTRAIQRLIQTC